MPDLNANAADNSGSDASGFLRMWDVTRMTGLGRSMINRLVAQDKLPSPVRLANRTIAWRHADANRWTEGRPTSPAGLTTPSTSAST